MKFALVVLSEKLELKYSSTVQLLNSNSSTDVTFETAGLTPGLPLWVK